MSQSMTESLSTVSLLCDLIQPLCGCLLVIKNTYNATYKKKGYIATYKKKCQRYK